MGVDLILLPLIGCNYWASHDILRLNRNSEFFEEINKLKTNDIPVDHFTCYLSHDDNVADGEPHYGVTNEDLYGKPLQWVYVEDLLKFKDSYHVTDDWQNKAVWAYLEQMPEKWIIVLYWS